MSVPPRRGIRSLRGTLSRQVTALGVVLAMLITVAVAGMVVTARNYRDVAQLTLSRQDAANQVLTDLLNAETGNRGYTLTGRGDYRSPYTEALHRYPADIARLRALVNDDTELLAAVEELDRRARLWFREARTLIALRRQGLTDAAVARFNRGEAKRRSDAFRAQHSLLVAELDQESATALVETDRRRDLTLYAVTAVALLALAVVAFTARRLWRRVGGPVRLLSQGMASVARGRPTEVVRSSDAVRELAELTDGFNLMQRQVFQQRDAVAAAVRREAVQRTERRMWETVQEGLLPSRLPVIPGHRLVARYRPAERALLIGGDFYDAEVLPDGRLAMIVGDMAGHGAPAAAQAAGLRFGWRTMVAVDPDPERVLSALNAQMSRAELRSEGLFATVIYALVDPDGAAIFACAGHPPPVLLTATGCHMIEPDGVGPVLGVMDEATWPTTWFTLRPGSTLVLFTDGLIEARAGEELFGVERVVEALAEERASAVEMRLVRTMARSRRFGGGALRDDVVVMALERTAEGPGP
ncbi:MAG: SpoIIE family protein phosphatase [Thermoleophilia bacterium]|nr:SpoIIE family protein phosphatase [Thermoleophilia bacterium]